MWFWKKLLEAMSINVGGIGVYLPQCTVFGCDHIGTPKLLSRERITMFVNANNPYAYCYV